jgi:hypothetical protein
MEDLSIEELASNLSTYKEQLSEVSLTPSPSCLRLPFPNVRNSSRTVRYRECSAAARDPGAVARAVS